MTTSPKGMTKKQQLIRMLKAKAGADVAAISKKLGWQPHTTRAALTGLRKSGYEIQVQKPKDSGVGRYRIISDPAPEQTKKTTALDHAG